MTVSAKMTTDYSIDGALVEAQPVAYIHPDSISALILAPEGAWMRVFTRGKQPPPDGWTPVYTAPPSAPVGVEELPPPFGYVEPRHDLSGYEVFDEPGPRRAAIWNLHGMQQALAQQPAAVDEVVVEEVNEKMAIAAYERHMGVSADDPAYGPDLSQWMAGWNAALASQAVGVG